MQIQCSCSLFAVVVFNEQLNPPHRATRAFCADAADVDMGVESAAAPTISRSQLKKRVANKHKDKLRKKGINVGKKKKNTFKF